MVLESLMNPLNAERNPKRMFILGFIYSSLAIFFSLWIFEDNASMVMVTLTTLVCAPLMYNTIKVEEQKDEIIEQEITLLKEHGKALEFFIFIFLGIVASSIVWYVFLPTSMIENLFSVQTATINTINSQPVGAFVQSGMFSKIFFNNIKVLIFCILFAFVYGLGAIFILTWNASVIAAAMGNFIRLGLAEAASLVGLEKIAEYFKVSFMSMLRYFLHGIPEIVGYFIGGLAAGIISVAVLRQRLDFNKFKRVLLDSSDLLIIAVMVLVFAAFLEVYVTPIFF